MSQGKYIPPSLRKQQQQQQVSSTRKQPSRHPKKAPDITSQQAFPSLLSNKEARYVDSNIDLPVMLVSTFQIRRCIIQYSSTVFRDHKG